MDWRNELTMEFLDLYAKEPAIWDFKNESHKDRNQIFDAWKRIQTSLSTNLSIKELKKKKECLMATYRKLAAKVQKTKGTGSSTCEVYKPEWFAFEKMSSFLHKIYIPRETQRTETSMVSNKNIPSKRKALNIDSDKHKRMKREPEVQREEMINTTLNTSNMTGKTEDECDIVGKLVAAKLRKMNNIQQIYAEKLINDVLYKGMLEQLDGSNFIGDYYDSQSRLTTSAMSNESSS